MKSGYDPDLYIKETRFPKASTIQVFASGETVYIGIRENKPSGKGLDSTSILLSNEQWAKVVAKVQRDNEYYTEEEQS